eukprot:RCo035922
MASDDALSSISQPITLQYSHLVVLDDPSKQKWPTSQGMPTPCLCLLCLQYCTICRGARMNSLFLSSHPPSAVTLLTVLMLGAAVFSLGFACLVAWSPVFMGFIHDLRYF